MKTITLAKLIESTNIPASLIRATGRQSGGWESFKEHAEDVTNHGASGGFSGWKTEPHRQAPRRLQGGRHGWRPGADRMQAAAAREADVPFLLSSASNDALEEVVEVAPDHVWFQMYCTSDEHINADLVQRARQAQAPVLVVSVDVPVNSNRERNKRNGFSRPFRMTPGVMLEALGHPAWVLRYLRTGGIPMMRNWLPYAKPGASAGEVADLYGTLTPAPMVSWDHLRRIRDAWSGPLVIKGLLHPDDAREAVRLGANGLVVSNHGGRQLDAAPSPLEMLPSIRQAVGPEVHIILDSGIRRGSDVVIARCLGADSAIFGRPTLYGVTVAGQAVTAVARELTGFVWDIARHVDAA